LNETELNNKPCQTSFSKSEAETSNTSKVEDKYQYFIRLGGKYFTVNHIHKHVDLSEIKLFVDAEIGVRHDLFNYFHRGRNLDDHSVIMHNSGDIYACVKSGKHYIEYS
jgi:hypothetical protein